MVIFIVTQPNEPSGEESQGRRAPRCTACGNRMKGHKDVKDCPRNKKA